jgi:negative regulator of sigma E activity
MKITNVNRIVPLLLFWAFAAHALEPDVGRLLEKSDQARGGSLQALEWEIQAQNSGSGADDQPNQRLRVIASNGASKVEILEPQNSKGTKILQVGHNMWIMKPGLKKPVAISARQRLTGQASIGDIAATNYVRDYNATYLREDSVKDEPCHVLSLSAKDQGATYDRVNYWISVRRGVALQAEFLSLSGKKLKSAGFEYANSMKINGQSVAFISQMTISDALTDAKTVLDFSRVNTIREPRKSEFDPGNLQ